MPMTDEQPVFEKILFEHQEKGYQIRLVLNEFRDVEYLHLRKYFLTFDEGFKPTKEGISIPANISSIYALLDGVIELVSKTEGMDSIQTHLAKKISDLTSTTD